MPRSFKSQVKYQHVLAVLRGTPDDIKCLVIKCVIGNEWRLPHFQTDLENLGENRELFIDTMDKKQLPGQISKSGYDMTDILSHLALNQATYEVERQGYSLHVSDLRGIPIPYRESVRRVSHKFEFRSLKELVLVKECNPVRALLDIWVMNRV